MIYKAYLTNVFTTDIFTGFKVVVCLLKRTGEESFLRKLAGELAWPATAYVLPQDENFLLRFFSEEGELSVADQALMAAAHVLRQTALWPSGKKASLLSRTGSHELSFNSFSQEIGLLLSAGRNEKIETAKAAQVIAAMGLRGEEAVAVEKSGRRLFVHCRTRSALTKAGWKGKAWPESDLFKDISSVAVSAPFEKSDLEHPGFEIFLLAKPVDQPASLAPSSGLSGGIIYRDEYDLSFCAAAASFWGEKLSAGKLAIQLLGRRPARLTATFLEDKRGTIISGQVKTIFKADLVNSE